MTGKPKDPPFTLQRVGEGFTAVPQPEWQSLTAVAIAQLTEAGTLRPVFSKRVFALATPTDGDEAEELTRLIIEKMRELAAELGEDSP